MSLIQSPCKLDYPASHSSGPRSPAQIKWIVIHSTEGPVGHEAARSVARFFANPATQASVQLVVDEDDCYRCLPNDVIPWGAPGANTGGFHIEHCAYASWTRVLWMAHEQTLRRGAYKAALHCKAFGIPPRWVGPVGLRVGKKGLTTHRDVSYAWPLLARKAGFHTDPGPYFPRDRYLGFVKEYLAGL